MKAMGFYNTGGPEVLQEIDVAETFPSKGEIIVRVDFTSVNNLDILMRSGGTKMNFNLPHIPGTDVSGTVEKIGEGVTGLSEGDRVISSTVYGCGACRQCLSGNEPLCKSWKVLGMHVWGSYAELVRIPSWMAIKPPKAYSPEELGCMPLSLSVSWRALKVAAKAREGETALIFGASGNSGIFSLMLAKAMGLRTIAVTSSEKKKEALKKAGADHVLILNRQNPRELEKEASELTGGEGAEIIIDPIGNPIDSSIAMLAHNGRIVAFGTSSSAESQISIKKFYWKSASLIGVHNASAGELNDAFAFAEKKGIKPIIHSKLRVDQAEEAHRLFSSSEAFGKILMEHKWQS